MKKANKILLNHLLLNAKLGILALGMSVILCMPAMTMSAQAIGHDNHYFGIAYLAEKEARATEKRAKTDNKPITANVKVTANEKQEISYDHKKIISLKKK